MLLTQLIFILYLPSPLNIDKEQIVDMLRIYECTRTKGMSLRVL